MPQTNIFIYGSLMHPDEIAKVFGDDISYIKSKLNGYVRDFSKTSYSWGDRDEKFGVLGLTKCDLEWCNGLIIKNVSQTSLNKYYLRETGMSKQEYNADESGYKIQQINKNKFETYNNSFNFNNTITSLINDRLEEPNTHQDYKNICYKAAKKYDNQFYNDFVESTYEYYEKL